MFSKFFTKIALVASISVLAGSSVAFSTPKAYALALPPVPVVTPSSAMDSASNPIYAIDMTACLEVFSWSRYMADIRNGITNSNPYDRQGCVTQPNLAFNGTRTVAKNASNQVTSVTYTVGNRQFAQTSYNNFAIGQASTKSAFGNLPVLGVFPNGSVSAQALNTYDVNGTLRTTVNTADRSDKNGFTSIFSSAQIGQIYSTGGAQTGMPRIPYTGANQFVNGTWIGGFCDTVNGKIAPKAIGPDSNGITWSVADYGLNPASPITTCSWPDTNATRTSTPVLYDPEGIVKDQNLAVYQFVYKVPFPASQTECNTLFPNVFSTYTQCLTWFQQRYSLPLTGSATGNAVYYTYTFYGTFNDKYTNWIGWVNPDINKARASFTSNATLDQLRAYYSDPEATLRQLFNDQTSSYGTLVTRMNNASQAIKDQYKAILQQRFESYIRGADGYSVYAI